MRLCVCAAAMVSGAHAATAAEDNDETPTHWRFMASPGVVHYHPSDEHRPVWALAVSKVRDDEWFYGGSIFSNSFGQKTGTVFVGERYRQLWGRDRLYFEWLAGPMYGYVGKYKDKVPLNFRGLSPLAVFSLGWEVDRNTSVQLNALGNAGIMLAFTYDLR